jgi:DNA-binding transcriptional ArsR family regulator
MDTSDQLAMQTADSDKGEAVDALALEGAPDLDQDELLANARLASEFLKALAHEARLVILCMLADGEKSVTELERMLDLRQPAVSQQLARLRADNLVEARREGKNIYYSLARPEVKAIIAALHAAFCGPKGA